MHYTIYKITNQIDGKFYIGSHKTKDLNDDLTDGVSNKKIKKDSPIPEGWYKGRK